MPTPEWMRPPLPPAPATGSGKLPQVLRQTPSGDGAVLVTVALPNLHTATVRVPEAAWVNGEHLLIGSALADFLRGMLPAGTIPKDPAGD